jgi:hypothetical protein
MGMILTPEKATSLNICKSVLERYGAADGMFFDCIIRKLEKMDQASTVKLLGTDLPLTIIGKMGRLEINVNDKKIIPIHDQKRIQAPDDLTENRKRICLQRCQTTHCTVARSCSGAGQPHLLLSTCPKGYWTSGPIDATTID